MFFELELEGVGIGQWQCGSGFDISGGGNTMWGVGEVETQMVVDIVVGIASDEDQHGVATAITGGQQSGFVQANGIVLFPIGVETAIGEMGTKGEEVIEGLADEFGVSATLTGWPDFMWEKCCEHGSSCPCFFFWRLGSGDSFKDGWVEAPLSAMTDGADVIRSETFLEVMRAVLPFHAHGVGGEAEDGQVIGVGMVDGDPGVHSAFRHQGQLAFVVVADAPQSQGGMDITGIVDITVASGPIEFSR